jgi:CBS domain-containing protein
MAQKIRDAMIPNPTTLPVSATIPAAARAMRDNAIGAAVVLDESRPCGILTDRDIVVRVLAVDRDPGGTTLGEVCSKDVAAVGPDEDIDHAVALMRERKLRRVPVLDKEMVVGIVSLGDLARERDPDSVLADISTAPPNR